MIDLFPVLGVCGYSGSGKTTLVEQIMPRLTERQLRVAVVKHDAHGISLDCPGKDSDRFFQAGADVLLQGPQEEVLRIRSGQPDGWTQALRLLLVRYDLILVEGHKGTPLPKVWLTGDDGAGPPSGVEEVIAVLPRGSGRVGRLMQILDDFLNSRWLCPPVLGAVLIGGKSTRMRRPKHLLRADGSTWLERTAELLGGVSGTVAIIGRGQVPRSPRPWVRLPDVPGVQGPLAGLLAAMRWAPVASWLVAPCDLPELTEAALEWLLSARAPGVWAVMGRLEGAEGAEPLPGLFDPRSRPFLEHLAAAGRFGLQEIALHPKVLVRAIPPGLAGAWRNVNFSADIR